MGNITDSIPNLVRLQIGDDIIFENIPVKRKFTVGGLAENCTVFGYGEYEEGDICRLEAIPDDDYEFVRWSDGSETNPRVFQVYHNYTIDCTCQAKPEPARDGALCITLKQGQERGSLYIQRVGRPTEVQLMISYDAENWYNYDIPYDVQYDDNSVITLDRSLGKDKVYFLNDSDVATGFSLDQNNYYKFSIDTQVVISGDIDSLRCYKYETVTSEVAYCYNNLFASVSGIESVQTVLKATTLASYCYANMFYECTGLTTAPELPATTLADYCYYNMFLYCISLTTAPELPATTLADYCYYNMFLLCTSLTTAPELPATTLTDSCYWSMFNGCSSLATAPELPATTLTSSCYYGMFDGCSSLATAPVLPATTLADHCYAYMFQDCRVLTTAPELPVTTLADYCYSYMFCRCYGLTTAPELPATELETGCYYAMFEASGLTTAPELPATTLADYCYCGMFMYCNGFTTAPELPAEVLVKGCYVAMFFYCTGINYIKCLAKNIDIPSETYTAIWVTGVSESQPTGTFVKAPGSYWPVGDSGVPSGWTIVNA